MTTANKLVDGEVVPVTLEDIEQREVDEAADFLALKAARIASVREDASRRVLAALPDMEKATAIREHETALVGTLSAKLKRHTLAAVNITAGWPE